ncbi:MAG: hypothetical protein WC788_04585 [Candidatus Paceibacterota bacterium]|jgi:hypothetical protein
MRENKLTDKQKKKIKALLIADRPTPGDVSIGDSVKKALRLSDKRFKELEQEIENYLVDYFDSRNHAK